MHLVNLGHKFEEVTHFEDVILKKILPIVTDVLRFGSLFAVLAVKNSQVARNWVVQKGINPNHFSFKVWICSQIVYVVAVAVFSVFYCGILKNLFPVCQLICSAQRARDLDAKKYLTKLGIFAGYALASLPASDASKYVPLFRSQFTLKERAIVCEAIRSALDDLEVVDKETKFNSYFLEPLKSDLAKSAENKTDTTLSAEDYKNQVIDVLEAVCVIGLNNTADIEEEKEMQSEYKTLCIDLLTDSRLNECEGGYFKTLEACGKLFDIDHLFLEGAVTEDPNRIMHSILLEMLDCDGNKIPVELLPDLYRYVFEYDPKSFTKPNSQCVDQTKKMENLVILGMPTEEAYNQDDLDKARRDKLKLHTRDEEKIKQLNIAHGYLFSRLNQTKMVEYNFRELKPHLLSYITSYKDQIAINNPWSNMPEEVAAIINGAGFMERLD